MTATSRYDMITKREAAIISAYTGCTMCSFDLIHEYIEEILERSVMTHELGSKYMSELIREKSKADFLKLCEEIEK